MMTREQIKGLAEWLGLPVLAALVIFGAWAFLHISREPMSDECKRAAARYPFQQSTKTISQF